MGGDFGGTVGLGGGMELPISPKISEIFNKI